MSIFSKKLSSTLDDILAECDRLRAINADLLEACKGFVSECENPAPDLVMKLYWFEKMSAAVAKAKEKQS